MMDQARHRARYRLLLRAYPKAHRQRSCDEMEEAFITLLRPDSERHGAAGRAACWLGAAWDALVQGTAARFGSPGTTPVKRVGEACASLTRRRGSSRRSPSPWGVPCRESWSA